MLITELMRQEVYKVSFFQTASHCLVMVTHRYLGVVILAVFATTVTNAEITVTCGKDSVKIRWEFGADWVPNASRLFLGSCRASQLNVLPTSQGEALFNYPFSACKFKKLMRGKRIIYQNELTYRPYPQNKPAAVVHPIECVYHRPDTWVPPFLRPGSGTSEGWGGLVFHMSLLNEELSGVAQTNVIPLGSFMPIWAAVEQKSHQPLLLLMEECVAVSTPDLQAEGQVYPIITNKGCLVESVRGNSMFLPRYHSSAIVLYLQAFKFNLGKEVYIHCKLAAWDPEVFNVGKKACNYIKETEGWELLDDPSQSELCSCCASTCRTRSRRGLAWGSHSQTSVLGPLIIVDPEMSVKSLV
ncbi:zona pellucida glycoprotein 3f, tandem duplicate 2 [Cynoglossus semilaevis]|nr:uncharacterized protein LOC103396600 [Cynoglossus semilaevis]